MGNFLFGGSSVQPIIYTGIQVQTSALDMPIPYGYGQNRISFNLIWYNNFQKHDEGGLFGKGGGKGDNYTYSAAVILALGEGIIDEIVTVYYNQNTTTTLSNMGYSFASGTATQTPWGYVVANYPSQALSYANTSYIYNDNANLGSAASLPSIAMEAKMKLSYTAGDGSPDADPSQFIPDFLTYPRYGMGLTMSNIDSTSLAYYKTYVQAQGIFMSPFLYNAEKATTILDRWAQLTNSWIFWSGNAIKFVPLGDAAITANGYTYTPTTAIQYSIGPEVFVGKEIPIKVNRIDPADAFNRTRVTISDRAQQYNSNPIFYLAANLITQYGLRDSNDIDAKEICQASIGLICATLIGQRAAYLRNTYEFTLPYRFLRLEPGDLVTITHPFIQAITNLPVRIRTIEENDKGELSVLAEEWPGTLGIYYPHDQQTGSYVEVNQLADPGNVN